MVAFGIQHAAAQFGIVLEPRVGRREFGEHLGRKAVALLRAIDTDQQQMATLLQLDPAIRVALRLAHTMPLFMDWPGDILMAMFATRRDLL